jgi:Ase1/PRC1/MAP65 family protein
VNPSKPLASIDK